MSFVLKLCHWKPMFPAFVALSLVLTVTACGGGSTSNPPSSSGGKTVQVSEKEWSITIDGNELTKGQGNASVPSGTVRFNIKNDGSVAHAFEIQGNGIDKKTDNIDPGKSGTLTVQLTAGKYEVSCPVAGHKEAGMDGYITAS